MSDVSGYNRNMDIRTCVKCGLSAEHRRPSCCKRCEAEATKQWRKANPERAALLNKEGHRRKKERDPGHDARRKALRRKRNPEHYRAKYKQRLAWLASGTVTNDQLKALRDKSNSLCEYCKRPVKCRCTAKDPRGFDHVIPRVRGGEHRIENIVVCCGPCNAIKSGA